MRSREQIVLDIEQAKRDLVSAQLETEGKKLQINGSFGKFGSPYSILYAPDLMIQTTIGGQLSILMLIEALHLAGFNVVSANTDGFVTKARRDRLQVFDAIIAEWEEATGFETEEAQYKVLHSRDVNNYIAITRAGKLKLKGAYTPAGPKQPAASGMKKNPQCEITIEAAVAYLRSGTAIEDTVHACTDVRKFVAVRRVNGGCVDADGQYVGKVIRFAYRKDHKGCLSYKTNGNTVPKTEGAFPLMELPDELPTWIDHGWYIREAYAILQDVGVSVCDPHLAGREGHMTARLPDQKTYHIVSLPGGEAMCGKRPATLRDRWQEGEGTVCKKCRLSFDLQLMTDDEFIRYGETLLDPELSSEFERECMRRLARMAYRIKSLEYQVEVLEK